MDWFKIGTGVRQGCVLALCLLNLHLQYIMRNAELDEAKTWIMLPGEILITSDVQVTPPLWEKVIRNLKNLLINVKVESEKAGWECNIQETEVMASVNYDHNHFIDNRWGKSGNIDRLYLLALHSFCRWWLQPWN